MRRRNFLAGAAAIPVMAGTSAAEAGRGPGQGGNHRPKKVRTGIEQLADSNFDLLSGQRVGVISNPTGIMPDLRHEVDIMVGSVDVAAAFGPEHGFRGTGQAGEGEDFFIDDRTGLPVYQAGNTTRMVELFEETGIDTAVFDIQDVGARFYTFIWTMYRSMEAAAILGKKFVVLDRPNPITGKQAMGPVLHPEHATGVGLKPISQQHGMTVGELAQLFNAEFLPEAVGSMVDLTVVPMRGWFRDMWYEDTGLPWVLPSPNMPTVDTAVVYPGTALFEATALSEGRGTTRPFELIAAPEVDFHWVEALNARDIPGVRFREAYFEPTFSKWAGEACGGVEVEVTDRDALDAIRTGLEMIIVARQEFPQYKWRSQDGPTRFWLDKLTGTDRARLAIDAGAEIDEVVAGWQDDLAAFRALRENYLIYDKHRRGGQL